MFLTRLLKPVFLVAVAALIAGCEAPPRARQAVLIKIASSEETLPLVTQLTASYTSKQAGVSFDIIQCETDKCRSLVTNGDVHLAIAPFATTDAADDLVLTPVGRDGIAVIVHGSNPTKSLTLLELQGLYYGRIGEWRELGGTDTPVDVVTREAENAVARQFETVVMAGWPVTPAALVLPSEEAVVDFVAEHPGAIGYVSAVFTDQRVTAIALEGKQPDPKTVTSGAYHITLDVYALNRAPTGPEVTSFLQYLTGPDGQAEVSRDYGRLP